MESMREEFDDLRKDGRMGVHGDYGNNDGGKNDDNGNDDDDDDDEEEKNRTLREWTTYE